MLSALNTIHKRYILTRLDGVKIQMMEFQMSCNRVGVLNLSSYILYNVGLCYRCTQFVLSNLNYLFVCFFFVSLPLKMLGYGQNDQTDFQNFNELCLRVCSVERRKLDNFSKTTFWESAYFKTESFTSKIFHLKIRRLLFNRYTFPTLRIIRDSENNIQFNNNNIQFNNILSI